MSRARKRSPLGWVLARAVDDPEGALKVAFGPLVADRIVQAVALAEFETAVRKRRPTSKRAGTARVSWRVLQAQGWRFRRALRRVARLVLRIAERLSLDSGRAAGGPLWLGRAWYASAEDGQVLYTPKDVQGGLAGYLGVSIRTVERYLAVLEAAGILKAWQPPLGEVDKLPKSMRGDVYAYQIYQWIGDLPRVLRGHLERWYGRGKAAKSAPSAAPGAAPTLPPPEGAAPAIPASKGAGSFFAKLAEWGLDGPPLPA